MFRLIDWALNKIAPVALTSDSRPESDDDWQSPIIDALNREYSQHAQILDRRFSGEEERNG